MATSTTTLLQVANAILLNVNERPIATLVNNQGEQLKNVIRTTLRKISHDNKWPWLEATVAGTWSGNLVTLPSNTSRIIGVFWQSTVSRALPLRWIHKDNFNAYQLDSYSSGGRPIWWTMEDFNSYRVNPYPTTAPEQAFITANVYNTLELPLTDTGVFAMPEEFIDLLILGGTALYANRHMEDDKLYQTFMTEYLSGMNIMRSQNYSTPAKAMNLYGGPTYGRDNYWR